MSKKKIIKNPFSSSNSSLGIARTESRSFKGATWYSYVGYSDVAYRQGKQSNSGYTALGFKICLKRK